MNRLGLMREAEYRYCYLFGVRINPRFAYASREDWYLHLKSLKIPKLKKVFARLDKHNRNGLSYQWLSNHLYELLINNCIIKGETNE